MKPILIAISLLVSSLSFSVFAQKTVTEKAPKVIQFNEVFTTVSIDDDLEVVLTNGSSDKIVVEGDVKATIADGHLYIAARNPRLASGMKVFVPADYLSKVYMNGNGSLGSSTVLQNHRVKILLTAEAKINVKSTGNITIETVDDIQFVKGR